MREIKFRVMLNEKSRNGGQWVYYNALDFKLVNKDKLKLETAGLFTGIQDKNGNDIYNGDILRYFEPGNPYEGESDSSGIIEVIWNEDYGQWYANFEWNEKIYLYDIDPDYILIIGNIHENPELLGDK